MFTFDAASSCGELCKQSGTGTPRYHHSSMVAGGAVAAAGQLGVRDGRILFISNESGHYMPPPSCLCAVLAVLAEMGIAYISAIQLQPVQSTLTQQSSHPPTPSDRARQPTAWRPSASPVVTRRRVPAR